MMVNEVERGFYNAGCSAPCLANLLASSFLTILVWAPTLRMVILWWEFFLILFTTWVMRSFLWLYWDFGFFMWLRRYILLRLSMNINVSIGSVSVCFMAIKSVYNYALRILGYSSTQASDIDL